MYPIPARMCVLAGAASAVFAAAAAGADRQPDDATDEASPEVALNLEPPPLTEVFLPAELEEIASRTAAAHIAEHMEEIEVEAPRAESPAPPATPAVWRGIFAPFWAVMNPSEAWRTLLPWPPERAAAINSPPDVTSGYLEPVAWPRDAWPPPD